MSESGTAIPDDFEALLDACERENPEPSSESVEGALDEETVDSMQNLARALRSLEIAQRGSNGLEEGLLDRPGLKDLERWLSHFVSPRDLQDSSSLRPVGRLVVS
jgi:hypothetical protein